MKYFPNIFRRLEQIEPLVFMGTVTRIAGSMIESRGPDLGLGDLCKIQSPDGKHRYLAEVIGFRHGSLILMPLHEIEKLRPGSKVIHHPFAGTIPLGDGLIGRVINALGEPIDGKGPIRACEYRKTMVQMPPHPLKRMPIVNALETGVRAIDGLLTIGIGQRIGIMAGSGVGKSVLFGMIARRAKADVNVIALIGERGREVAEFLQRDLGEEGLRKSVVIVSTSDEMPIIRRKAAFLATTVAEYFRDQGQQVILMMDSLTRVAMAQREIGLAVGEPPTTRGYTPSMFSLIPRLLERAGNSEHGSITGIYTILVEGDDFDEPVADTARGTLDGHIVLSRELAAKAHFPAIDVLQSTSRVMPMVVSREHLEQARMVRELLAVYRENEDLINIGAYQKGSHPRIDLAIEHIDRIHGFLRQPMDEFSSFEQTLTQLKSLVQGMN